MADECVVCGEAEEGKPLYKKLGSGEFNVEVITALKALQMLTIPEAAKNSSYICWDCDELIVEQYDRYLKEQIQVAVSQKQTKKQQHTKKKKKPDRDRLKLTISKNVQRESSWGTDKPQPEKQGSKKPTKAAGVVISSSHSSSLSKTKQLEKQRATNAYHFSHCLMCDSNFENESRTYQRFSLKNRVNDEMDIAQVMEVLGLARHIAPDLKARRYVCNPCFVIIRRSYKDKLMKETTKEVKAQPEPSTLAPACPQASIHRATTEEHAAEIAKLLPPGLAECYKIMTQNPVNKKMEVPDTPQREHTDKNICQPEWEEHCLDEEEEGEGALIVSQDEHGNYIIDVDEQRAKKGSRAKVEDREQLAIPHPPQKKKNVLLPKRMHKHLSLSSNDTPGGLSDTSSGEAEDVELEPEEGVKASIPPPSRNLSQEAQSRMCSICGITISRKPSNWWHTLSSPLASFDNITVSTALKLLETCLASTSADVREDHSVCLPCYTKVSTGFKSQVVQRIAHQRNIDVSEVNLLHVKVRMLPKEALEAVEAYSTVGRTTEATKVFERLSDTLPMASSPEEAGEGEKENMYIEKLIHKRKKEENYNPDKRSKLHRSEIDRAREGVMDGTGTDVSQDTTAEKPTDTPLKKRGFHCPRGKNGRFMKNVTTEQPQARTPATHTSQKEKASDTPTSTQGPQTKQHKDTKEIEPLVILKDLKFVLPQEAFSGKTVSSHKIESIMEPPSRSDQTSTPHTALDTSTSPLQLVFSALSVYHPPIDEPEIEAPAPSTLESPATPKVCGRCVVCGCNFTVPQSALRSVEDNVRPPTLLVPVRWVCVSLAVCLPQVSEEDARLARVCEQCFKLLGDQFELFVKKKVGELCGLEADAVDLSEYLFTFNPTTMNLEADPKQQSYIHEFEDVGQLLQRIHPLVEQFSLDEVVGEGERQPVLEQHFCVWLLLVLNELRMQIGAAIGDLAQWLVALMPSDMYESGLRPCPNNLASFLLNITSCFRNLTQDMLEGPIPAWVFVAENTFHATEAGKAGTTLGSKGGDEDLCWEDFLHHVNFDALIGGRAQPVAPEHFTQGLVYAVWRTSQLLGEGELQVMDWLRQLSPLPMSKEQLENLLTMIGTMHSHLEEHPEDIHELQHEVILQQPANDQNLVQSLSLLEKTPHTPPGPQTNGSCKTLKHQSITHRVSDSKEEKGKTTSKPSLSKRRRGSKLNNLSHKKLKLNSDMSNANINTQESDSSQGSSGCTQRAKDTKGTSEEMDITSRSLGCAASTIESAKEISKDTIGASEEIDITSGAPRDASPITESAKEVVATPEPSPENMTTSVPSEKIANITETAEDIVVTPELSEENVTTSKPTKNTTDIIEPTAEIGAHSEPLEENMTTNQPTEKTTNITDPTAETAVSISQPGGETLTNYEPLNETAVATERRQGSALTAESSEESPSTTDLVKDTASFFEPAHKTTSTSEPAEESTATSGPAEDTTVASKLAEITATSVHAEETTATSLCAEETTAISVTAEETTTTSVHAEETTGTYVHAEETITTSVPTEETTATSVPTEETTATCVPAEETKATSLPAEETTATSLPSEETTATALFAGETTATSVPAEETTATSVPSEEITATSLFAEETTATSLPAEETTATSVSAEEITATSLLVKKTTATSLPAEETTATFVPAEETTATSLPAEETTATSLPAEETTATSLPAEETTATSLPAVETTATSLPAEETTATSLPAEETTATSVPSEETTATSVPAEETTATSVPAKETTATSVPAEETTATSVPAEETTATSVPAKETTATSVPAKETAAMSVPAEETTATYVHAEETTTTSVPVKETTATSVPVKESTATSVPVKETTATSVPVKESTATSVPVKESTATSVPVKETTATSVPVKESTATSVPVKETTATSVPAEETTTTSVPAEEITATSVPAEEITATFVPAEETTATSVPVETTATSMPAEENTVASWPAGQSLSTVEPAEKTAGTTEASELSAVTVEDSEDRTATTEPAEQTLEPPKERAATSVLAAQTLEPLEARMATTEPAEQTLSPNQHAEAPGITEIPKEIPVSPETLGDMQFTPEPSESTVTTAGLCKDPSASSGFSRDAKVTAEESPAILGSSGQDIATRVITELSESTVTTPALCSSGLSKDAKVATKESPAVLGPLGQDVIFRKLSKTVVTTVYTKETATTTTAISPSTATPNKRPAIISSITTMQPTLCPPPTRLPTSYIQNTVNNSRVTSTLPGPAATKITTTPGNILKTTISGHQKVLPAHTVTNIKTSSTTILTSPSQKDTSSKSRQCSMIKVSHSESSSVKTNCEPLGSGLQTFLQEKSLGDGQKVTDLQSTTKKSESQAQHKEKNEHCFSEPEEKGSSPVSIRTLVFHSKHHEPSSTSASVHLVTRGKQKGDTPHQVNRSVSQGKEKEPWQAPDRHMTTEATKKKSVQSSKDRVILISKKKVPPDAPVLGARSALHRSERVCIRVSTANPESTNLEDHKNEHLLGSNTVKVWQYNDSHKERLRTEKREIKGNHSSSSLTQIHRESREAKDNSNIENSSVHPPRTSSKSVVKHISSVHTKDKHSTKSEKCKMEDKEASSRGPIMKEKYPYVPDKRHKNTLSTKVPVLHDKGWKSASVENQYEKEKVEGVPQKSIHKEIKVTKSHHKPATKKNVGSGVLEQKKCHDKTPVKSGLLEEKEQARKARFSSPTFKPDKSFSGRTPGKRGAAPRTPHRPSEKKRKLSFEELMNYDIRGTEHP